MAFVVAGLHRLHSRWMVDEVLGGDGHTVVLFNAGGPTVAEALAGAPDLVIIEGQLVDMTADQACRALRSHPSTAHLPILVCAPMSAPDSGQPRGGADTGLVRVVRLRPADLRAAVAVAVPGHPGNLRDESAAVKAGSVPPAVSEVAGRAPMTWGRQPGSSST